MTEPLEAEANQEQELPAGWVTVPLAQVAPISNEHIEPSELKQNTLYIGLEHIESKTGRLVGHGTARDVLSTKSLFFQDDVLYGKLRPYLSKVHKATSDGICSTDIVVFRPTFAVEPDFIYFRLLANDFVDYASQNQQGVNHPRVSPKILGEYPLALPPLEEQRRIVEKLEALFSELDSAVQSLEAALSKLKRYRQAVLKAAVEGELSREWREAHRGQLEPASELLKRILAERRQRWEEAELAKMQAKGKIPQDDKWKARYVEPEGVDSSELPELPEGWVWATPEQLSSHEDYSLAIGPFGSNLKVSDYTNEGIPLVFVRNIRSSVFGGDDTKFVSTAKAGELRSHWVYPGDILVTKMGDPPGDACLYPSSAPVAVITADCIRWKLSELLSPKNFFVYALRSEQVRTQILGITRGVAQLKVSLGRFKNIAIPIPPFREQHYISQEIDRLLSEADKTEEAIRASLKRAERLRQAVLKEAFSGRLVPQDPADEPAAVLLERLRAARQAEAGKKGSGKRKAQALLL